MPESLIGQKVTVEGQRVLASDSSGDYLWLACGCRQWLPVLEHGFGGMNRRRVHGQLRLGAGRFLVASGRCMTSSSSAPCSNRLSRLLRNSHPRDRLFRQDECGPIRKSVPKISPAHRSLGPRKEGVARPSDVILTDPSQAVDRVEVAVAQRPVIPYAARFRSRSMAT